MAAAVVKRVAEHFADAVGAGVARIAFSGGEAVQSCGFGHFHDGAAVRQAAVTGGNGAAERVLHGDFLPCAVTRGDQRGGGAFAAVRHRQDAAVGVRVDGAEATGDSGAGLGGAEAFFVGVEGDDEVHRLFSVGQAPLYALLQLFLFAQDLQDALALVRAEIVQLAQDVFGAVCAGADGDAWRGGLPFLVVVAVRRPQFV